MWVCHTHLWYVVALHESFLCKMVPLTDPWKFSPSKVSHYTVFHYTSTANSLHDCHHQFTTIQGDCFRLHTRWFSILLFVCYYPWKSVQVWWEMCIFIQSYNSGYTFCGYYSSHFYLVSHQLVDNLTKEMDHLLIYSINYNSTCAIQKIRNNNYWNSQQIAGNTLCILYCAHIN